MEAKPEPGLYKLSVNAVPVKADPRWVGNIGVVLSLKVMCAAVVESFEIGIGDADQSTQPKFERLVFCLIVLLICRFFCVMNLILLSFYCL